MIIFGSRGITTTPDRGEFHCPSCGAQQQYARRRVRRFFTLYFIPVIPLDMLGEYIECGNCKGTYKAEVLDYRPGPDSGVEVEAEFHRAIKRTMALMSLADGQVDEAEIDTMTSILGDLMEQEVPRTTMEEEVAQARTEGGSVTTYLSGVGPVLNDHGKEMIIKAVCLVAGADGVFDESEKAVLSECSQALQMTPAHLKGILAEMRG